jgi:hypothetical protein
MRRCSAPPALTPTTMHRRDSLRWAASGLWAVGPLGAAFAAETPAAQQRLAQRLRQGGVVMAFRHATAPGTFDPPQFKLGDCSTQRNLSEAGRQQARQIGAWFRAQGLQPAQVRSSPWCRCVDTATLAFTPAAVQAWAALGSPVQGTENTNTESLAQLRRAALAVPAGRFEVWVTHMFVLQALAGENTNSGEGLLLGPDAQGGLVVLDRAQLA